MLPEWNAQLTTAPPQHRLYFLPEPLGHRSFRSVFGRSAPPVVVKITSFQDDPLGRRFSRGLAVGRGFGWSERSQAESDLLGHLEGASQARDRAAIGKEHLCCNATGAEAAAQESFHPCELCGQPGKLREERLIKTLCDEHASESGETNHG